VTPRGKGQSVQSRDEQQKSGKMVQHLKRSGFEEARFASHKKRKFVFHSALCTLTLVAPIMGAAA